MQKQSKCENKCKAMKLSKYDALALLQNLLHTSLAMDAISIDTFHNQGVFGLRLPLCFGQMATPILHCFHNDAVIAKNEVPFCCRTTKVHHPKSTTINLILFENEMNWNDANCDAQQKGVKTKHSKNARQHGTNGETPASSACIQQCCHEVVPTTTELGRHRLAKLEVHSVHKASCHKQQSRKLDIP